MTDLALIVPMAGRGSRFAREGILEPKPLIDLAGRPYFWWATESIRRVAPLRQLLFVVLQEHVDEWQIDRRIAEFYPTADLVVIADVTSGAAQTARYGVDAVRTPGPVAINDCDHAFICPDLATVSAHLEGGVRGALMCFQSSNAAYSYVRLDDAGRVVGTIEKQVVSPLAIAGCYLFTSPTVFTGAYDRYRATCTYDELFVSGLYNILVEDGFVSTLTIDRHLSFGTPAERASISESALAPFLAWR